MKSREHKLDICFDFTRGSCRRGDGCRFSHNLPPGGVIPPRPKTAGVCFDYTKGICNRGCVSRRSRRPRRDLRRDLARPVTRERRRIKKRERFLTIDACSFSPVRRATRLPLSFLPPPLTITRPTPQGRVPFLARRAGGRGVRETRGERREPDFVQGAAEAASGPGGEKNAGGVFGRSGAPRRTGEPSHAIASNAKHAKHVGPAANANASRRDDPGSIAKTNAPASPARTNGNGKTRGPPSPAAARRRSRRSRRRDATAPRRARRPRSGSARSTGLRKTRHSGTKSKKSSVRRSLRVFC